MSTETRKAIHIQESLAANIEHILESMSEGVILADESGALIYANTKFTEIVGYTVEEMIGKKVYELFLTDNALPDTLLVEQMHRRYQDRLKGISETYELKITRKDGQSRWLEISAGPLKNASGVIIGSIGINTDITKRKELEHQLQVSQKMEVVGRLAGGLAHDFNNLLTVISGYANLLQPHFSTSEKGYRHVEAIREASKLASSLTKQLMTVSRKQILQLESVDINKIVIDSMSILQNLVGSHVVLSVKLEEGLPMILADVSQIQQVLINLILNSRDAMKGEGRITIKTFVSPPLSHDDLVFTPIQTDSQYVVLSVTDNGCGIPDKVKKHLFEPFFTTKKKGSGLGLSTVYGIVGQHNGKISVTSEEGIFTTFEICIPVSQLTPEELISRQDARISTYTGGTETILLVEDEYDVKCMIKDVLEQHGYRVIAPETSQEALKIIETSAVSFDMLVSDVVMAEVNGFELARMLRTRKLQAKIILMSGCVQDLEIPEELKNERIPFIQKPFEIDDFLYRMRTTFDNTGDCPILSKALLEF